MTPSSSRRGPAACPTVGRQAPLPGGAAGRPARSAPDVTTRSSGTASTASSHARSGGARAACRARGSNRAPETCRNWGGPTCEAAVGAEPREGQPRERQQAPCPRSPPRGPSLKRSATSRSLLIPRTPTAASLQKTLISGTCGDFGRRTPTTPSLQTCRTSGRCPQNRVRERLPIPRSEAASSTLSRAMHISRTMGLSLRTRVLVAC